MAKSLSRTRHWVSSPTYASVVAAVVEARQEAGLSQKVLSGRLGKPPSFIAKIEIGERRLDVVEFVAIARALGVDERELFARVVRGLPAELAI